MSFGRKIEFDQPTSETPSGRLGRPIQFSQKEISKLRSVAGALPKGFVSEFLDVAKGIRSLVGLQERPEAVKTREFLEENLPTREEAVEKGLERAGRTLPYLAVGGGSVPGVVGRSLLAGAAGQTAEELGAGPLGQTAAEIAALGAPSLGRKIIPTKGQEKLVSFARKAGLSEKQIAPLLPEKGKKAFFGKMSSKGEKTQKSLAEMRQGLGQAYEFVKASPSASKTLSESATERFLNDSAKIAMEMPFEIRKQIFQDAQDLLRSDRSGANLINFYQDISSKYKLGREHLERLKKPILEALESISPELAEDFKMTNEMWKRGLSMRKILKPKVLDDLIDLGEAGSFAYGVFTGKISNLAKIIGLEGARKLSSEMLTNPRLQNIVKQMAKSSNQGKYAQVSELSKYLIDRYQED